MGYPTDRVIVYDRQGGRLGDLAPGDVMSRVRTEELNGEHTLTIATTRPLEVGMRLLTVDGTGKWHEWVVDTPDEEHLAGQGAIGTYRAMWSIQYDLAATAGGVLWASASDGENDPINAASALDIALTNSPMWQRGTCDVATTGAASLFDGSVWDYLSTIVSVWGGEVDAEISVGTTSGTVIDRRVALRAHLGVTGATRRFDWGSDLTGIRRVPDPGPYYCRVVPRGGGEATDADGVKYSDRCGIESENGGVPYLQDDDAAQLFRTRLPNGEWFYPTKVVTYQLDTKGDEEELYNKALADLHSHTRPAVTYEASVTQLTRAGMDAHGVALGDAVQCVDRGFGETALRVEGRVVGMEVNELDEADTVLTIGRLRPTLADEFRSLASTVGSVSKRVTGIETGGTFVYLRSLMDEINREISASGGYTYAVPGVGIRTYDVDVADPATGEGASRAVEMRGGYIRIAGGRTADGDWDWRTILESGHIASDLVTTVHVTSGTISDAYGAFYADLDNGTVRVGGMDVASLEGAIEDARGHADNYLTYDNSTGELTLGANNTGIRNVMANERMAFRTRDGDKAGLGLFGGVWKMFIDTATVESRLEFGRFAWIRRDNGNMSLKWTG